VRVPYEDFGNAVVVQLLPHRMVARGTRAPA
jgi:hypothetical protein